MQKIALVGTGNVAHHLARAISGHSELELSLVLGRNPSRLQDFKVFAPVGPIEKCTDVDMIVIAVKDDVIVHVSEQLKGSSGIIVHTSGSAPMDVLNQHENHGVLYPLQTFSTSRAIDFSEIPLVVEGNSSNTLTNILQIAGCLSNHVSILDSKKRQKLHLSAVISNNFTNHLLYLSQKWMDANGLSFNLLLPLMEETIKKLYDQTPFAAQTGPARRGDHNTIETHLKQITDARLKEVYELMSASILETYGKKL